MPYMPDRIEPRLAVCTSDWHVTAKTPTYRKDGYSEQQFEKIKWILELCRNESCVLFNAGDVFDTARQPRWLVNKYMALFNSYRDVAHYACAGQHDQLYHSKDLADTSFGTLVAASMLLRTEETVDWGGWDVLDPVPDIVVGHYCVTPKPVEFIDYSLTASEFMGKFECRIAVTGDYHHAHHWQEGGRLLVNPGGLMRNSRDSIDKQPVVYLIDLDNATVVDIIDIPVKPKSEVFLLSKISKDKGKEREQEEMVARFDKYISKVSGQIPRPDFQKMLEKVVAEEPPAEEVATEIDNMITGG